MKRVLRLTSLIQKEMEAVGNPNRLMTLINNANVAVGSKARIDRRTLIKIANEPETINFSVDMLTALDVYFAPKGESLQDKPIFEKRGILECLVEKRKVAFFLGSKPRRAAHRNDISRWDARSLARLIGQACQFDLHMDYDIEDVLLESQMDERTARERDWYDILDDDSRSLVAIGSPRACLASEVMLARMFDVPPFKAPALENGLLAKVPFAFHWPARVSRGFRSGFTCTTGDLESTAKKGFQFKEPGWRGLIRRGKASAFIMGDQVLAVPLGVRKWDAYGVIVAQRRSAGNVWLVVAGITGPATYAAAMLVNRLSVELPAEQRGDGPILLQAVKTAITTDKSRKAGDNREIGSPAPWCKPLIWK